MNVLVLPALYGWPLISMVAFALLGGRRGALLCAIGGTALLPIAEIPFPALPDFDKQTAIALGLMLGMAVFDAKAFGTFRPRWFDLPILLLVIVPMGSSMTNGLGPYDGIAAVFERIVDWGIPYLAGRIYFTEAAHMRELAIGVVLGGLAYVPLCLVEIRLSPQLHTWVYGWHQHSFGQTRRFGGYHPTVFMNHGLMVALWMTFATLCAAWLWLNRSVRSFAAIPAGWAVAVLVVTTTLCKSVGSFVLMAAGLAALVVSRRYSSRWPLRVLIILPLLYVTLRATGVWSGESLVERSKVAGEMAASSLETRIVNETLLVRHALRKPLLGWAMWGRNRPEVGKNERVITDGYWVLILGWNGVVGLLAFMTTLLLSSARVASRCPSAGWRHPSLAGLVALAFVLALYTTDCLFNANLNAVCVLGIGALASSADSLVPTR